jgi:paraquat-inducible protein B
MTDKAAYRAPEMISEEELRAAREKSRRTWSVQLLPLVPVVALLVGAGLYWLATTTDTKKFFGPAFAQHVNR